MSQADPPTAGLELHLVGRLVEASNATFLVEDADATRYVYKPVRGEAPLWDFPNGTLARREVAAHELSRAAGFDVVPPTRMVSLEPLGPGSLQLWVDAETVEVALDELDEVDEVDDDPADGMPGADAVASRPDAGGAGATAPGDGAGDGSAAGAEPDDQVGVALVPVELVDLVTVEEIPEGWYGLVIGEDGEGHDLALTHPDDPRLRRLALFDVIANNADRKAPHIIVATDGRVLGVDHGVCFHAEPKLRTVLWGFMDEPLTGEECGLVESALRAAGSGVLDPWLEPSEVQATMDRATALLESGRFPDPGDRWPAIPWPPV